MFPNKISKEIQYIVYKIIFKKIQYNFNNYVLQKI